MTAKPKPTPASVVVKLDNYRQIPASCDDSGNQGECTVDEFASNQIAEDSCDAHEIDDKSVDLTFADANCYEDAELEILDPFDEDKSSNRPTTICFNKYVKVIDYETGSNADDLRKSVGCPNDEDNDNYDDLCTNSTEPLRLDGKHLDCGFLPDETGHSENVHKTPPIAEDATASPDLYAPIITVTKMDLECRRSAARSGHSSDLRSHDIESNNSPFPPEHNQIVAELHEPAAQERAATEAAAQQHDRDILQHHFRRWMHYVTVERIAALNGDKLKIHGNDSRAHKIEQYLRGIRHEKKVRVAPTTTTDDAAGGTEGPADNGLQAVAEKKRRTEMSGFAAGVMVKKFSNK